MCQALSLYPVAAMSSARVSWRTTDKVAKKKKKKKKKTSAHSQDGHRRRPCRPPQHVRFDTTWTHRVSARTRRLEHTHTMRCNAKRDEAHVLTSRFDGDMFLFLCFLQKVRRRERRSCDDNFDDQAEITVKRVSSLAQILCE